MQISVTKIGLQLTLACLPSTKCSDDLLMLRAAIQEFRQNETEFQAAKDMTRI